MKQIKKFLTDNRDFFSQDFKSIVCLNSSKLFCKSIFQYFPSAKIIAADGGNNHLLKKKIKPNIIIGDLDSIVKNIYPDIQYIELNNQDKCDFEKTMIYIQENQLNPSIILGINGGYLDRIIQNLNIFCQFENNIFIEKNLLNFCLFNPGQYQFNIKNNSKISIIPLNQAIVSTKGLKWELNKSKLNFPGLNSSLNRVITHQNHDELIDLKIHLHHGKIIISVYLCQEN